MTIPDSEIIKNDDNGIPDKALYDLILKAVLNDSDGILTKKEAKSVNHLSTNYNETINIKSLKGLDYCINLSSLRLNNQGNEFTDISVLANLTNLTNLTLDYTKTNDIAHIASLTNLTDLSLSNNNISDISAITNLTSLTGLVLSHNNISDISALKNLTNLSSLSLEDNQITSIDSVMNLTNLEWLLLANNKITTLPNLKKLTKLYPGLYGPDEDYMWYVSFYGNTIPLSNAKNNLPECLTVNSKWMDRQKFIQDTAKEQLSEEIKNIDSKNYDLSKYTVDSWNAFSSALANARAVLSKETTNEEYATAFEALKTAKDSLQLKDVHTPESNIPKTNNTTVTSASPKTGDDSQVLLFTLLSLGSLSILGIKTYKRI